MTNELIPVFTASIGTAPVNAVDARTLHAFLASKQDFSTWIKARIQQFGFVENQDFVTVNKKMEVSNQSVTTTVGDRIDYYLTFDMGKELSMVERNTKGKQARQYFIECERRLLQPSPAELSREQILIMALDSERERVRLAAELEKVQPMVQFHEEVAQSEGEFTVDETCAALFNGAIPAKELRNWLKHHDWLDSRPKVNKPTEWAIHRGFMRLRVDTINRRTFLVPVFTPNGLELLRHLYRTNQLFTACIPADRLLAAPALPA